MNAEDRPLFRHFFPHLRQTERTRFGILLAVILCFGLLLSLQGLKRDAWLDEAYTLQFISAGSFGGMISVLRQDTHPPLYYLLLYPWSKISAAPWFLRLLSVVISLATAAVVMLWVRLYNRRAALLAGIWMVTLPVLLRYSLEMRMYGLLLFGTALAFFYASRVLREPKRNGHYAGLAAGFLIAVCSHLVGVMVIPAVLVFMLISGWRVRVVWWKVFLAATAAVAATGLFRFVFLESASRHAASWWMARPSPRLIWESGKYLFGLTTVQQAVSAWLGPLSAITISLLIVVPFGVWLAVLFLRDRWRRDAAFPLAAGVYAAAVLACSILMTPILWYRTLLPLLVPVAAFIALRLTAVRPKQLRRVLIAFFLIMCGAFALIWVGWDAHRPIENWRRAVDVMRSERKPGDPIMAYSEYTRVALSAYLAGEETQAVSLVDPEAGVRPIEARAQPDGNPEPRVFLIMRADESLDAHPEFLRTVLTAARTRFSNVTAVLVRPDTRFPPASAQNYSHVIDLLTGGGQLPLGRSSSVEMKDDIMIVNFRAPDRGSSGYVPS